MKITIIDDEQDILSSLSRFLKSLGHTVFTFTSAVKALEELPTNGTQLVLTDINMPIMTGYDLLHEMQQHPQLRDVLVVLFTAFGGVKGAVKAMREGAYDYILKPIDMNELMILVNRIAELKRLQHEHIAMRDSMQQQIDSRTREVKQRYQQLHQSLVNQIGLGEIAIFSDSMRAVFALADRLHRDPAVPILIEGETGTGKEVVAKYIHYGVNPEPRPFVDINCAALPHGLFETELFGYEAGAYTGAKREGEPGKIQLAENGTLFLDEIGELSQDQQAKLLRLIQERQYFPVGGTRKRTTNARIICATNRPVRDELASDFRRDFYYRLQVGHVRIPPLRERPEEIVPMAGFFLRILRRSHPTSFKSIQPSAQRFLMQHHWPGNVRELRNTIERVLLLYQDQSIEEHHLRQVMGSHDPQSQGNMLAPCSSLPESAFSLDEAVLHTVAMALERNHGNKSKTARYLGIPRNRLYNYLKRHDDNE